MKFMITIALPKELGGKGFITTVEVIYVRRSSSETNQLRYVHSIRGTPRDITIEEREINCTLRYKVLSYSFLNVVSISFCDKIVSAL